MKAKRIRVVTEGNKAEVDLTPMLDVVFILLIFFVVTVSFVKESTLNLNPPPEEQPKNRREPVTVTQVSILEDNSIWVNDYPVTSVALRSMLARIQAEAPDGAQLVVAADDKAHTNTFVTVLNTAKGLGIKNVVMASPRMLNTDE